MKPRCYVGNIPYTTTEDELKAFFSAYNVTEVKIIMDRETNRPRGFAFVGLSSPAELQDAVANLDGQELGGREIRVSEAKEKERGAGGGHSRNRAPQRKEDYGDTWKR